MLKMDLELNTGRLLWLEHTCTFLLIAVFVVIEIIHKLEKLYYFKKPTVSDLHVLSSSGVQ